MTALKKKWVVLSLAGGMVLSGCAHQGVQRQGDSASLKGEPHTINDILNEDPKDPEKTGVITVRDDGDLIFRGTKLKTSKFDIPITINSRVEYWVDYFCGKGRKHFDRYLERSEFFIPYMEPLLRQNNMPSDLVYLSMIESGFNNMAKSRAKAVGPWQFMTFTGRRYGLQVNWWVDERRDIRKSTLAAIEYLRELYNMFGSWELAAAAYNAGEAKVARAIQRYGTRDFWTLARHRFFRPETRDYVPKMIAAAIIHKNREQFGFKVPAPAPAADEAIAPSGEIVKVVKSEHPQRDEVPEDAAEPPATNPEESEAHASADTAKVARGEEEEDVREEDESSEADTAAAPGLGENEMAKARPVATPHLSKQGEISGEQLVEFEIQSPMDLLNVASASGLSYQTVKSLNPELLRWCTPPTSKSWKVKLPVSVRKKFLEAYNSPGFQKQVQFLTYHARSGDTLSRIAARFGLRVDPVADMNHLPAKMRLQKGTRVILPLPLDRSRSLASLEVREPAERRSKRRRSKKSKRISAPQRETARSKPWKAKGT